MKPKEMEFFTRFNAPIGPVINQEGETSKTRQSEKDNCDINKIMERFNRTGQLPQTKTIPPQYGDAIPVDYMTALNIIKDAETAFLTLPAKVRQHFGQDPQNYLSALQDTSPENVKALLKLGILVEPKETAEDTLRDIRDNTRRETQPVPQLDEKNTRRK